MFNNRGLLSGSVFNAHGMTHTMPPCLCDVMNMLYLYTTLGAGNLIGLACAASTPLAYSGDIWSADRRIES